MVVVVAAVDVAVAGECSPVLVLSKDAIEERKARHFRRQGGGLLDGLLLHRNVCRAQYRP